jgi:hypothetical protein
MEQTVFYRVYRDYLETIKDIKGLPQDENKKPIKDINEKDKLYTHKLFWPLVIFIVSSAGASIISCL